MDIFYLYFHIVTGKILNLVNFHRYNYEEIFDVNHLHEITEGQHNILYDNIHSWSLLPPHKLDGEIVETPEADIPPFIIDEPI